MRKLYFLFPLITVLSCGDKADRYSIKKYDNGYTVFNSTTGELYFYDSNNGNFYFDDIKNGVYHKEYKAKQLQMEYKDLSPEEKKNADRRTRKFFIGFFLFLFILYYFHKMDERYYQNLYNHGSTETPDQYENVPR